MNRPQRAILAVGLGVGTTFGAYELGELMGFGSGFPEDVQTCAQALGQQSVTASVVIDKCASFTHDFKESAITNANDVRQVGFVLPSPTEFTAAHMPEALHKEQNARNFEWGMAGFVGMIAAGTLYIATRYSDSRA